MYYGSGTTHWKIIRRCRVVLGDCSQFRITFNLRLKKVSWSSMRIIIRIESIPLAANLRSGLPTKLFLMKLSILAVAALWYWYLNHYIQMGDRQPAPIIVNQCSNIPIENEKGRLKIWFQTAFCCKGVDLRETQAFIGSGKYKNKQSS